MNEPGAHPKDLLSAYFDDELEVDARATVDRHLAGCEDCRQELDALRRLSRAVAGEEPPAVPLDLVGRIARSLDAGVGARRQPRRFMIPATIAATIMAIGILVTLQWREGRITLPEAPTDERREVLEAPKAPPAPAAADEKYVNVPVPEPSVPRPSVAPEPELAPREEKKEGARVDALEKDLSAAHPPMPEQGRLKQKSDAEARAGVSGGTGSDTSVDAARERVASKVAAAEATAPSAPGVSGGVKSGVLGEVEGGVPGGVASPCAERWSDSGLRANWDVADEEAAAGELVRLGVAVGGSSEWRGVADGRPFVLIVPRGRFDEVFYVLRARGVTGLERPPLLDPGVECEGISVTLIRSPQ